MLGLLFGLFLGLLKFLGIALVVLLVLLLSALLTLLFVPLRYKLFFRYDKDNAAVADISLTWFFSLVEFSIHYDKISSLSTRLRVAWKDLSKALNHDETEKGKEKRSVIEDGDLKENGYDIVPELPLKEEYEEKSAQPFPTTSKISETGESERGPSGEKADAQNADKRKNFRSPWREFRKRMENRVTRFRNRVRRFFQSKKNLYRSVKKLYRLATDPLYHRVILFLCSQLKKLILHSIPKKFQGRLHFGFSDPYTTGQVLSYLSLLYHPFHKSLTVIPEFEKEIMEIEISAKGRFGLYYLVYVISSILLNKDCRRAYKRLRSGKIFV